MDYFDFVILIYSFLLFFSKKIFKNREKILFGLIAVILLTQVIIVGLKWQYFIIYLLIFIRIFIRIFDFSFSKKYLNFLSYLIFISLGILSVVLIYIFPVPNFEIGEEKVYSVGYEEHHLKFENRKNPTEFVEISNLSNNTQRELLLDIYYPSKEGVQFNQLVRNKEGNWGKYIIDYLNRTWNLKLPTYIFSHLKLSKFEAQKNLQVAPDQKFPILIYSHGWAGEKIFASDQLIHLAANGYIVISIDHTGLAMFTDLPSGIIFNTGSSENSSDIFGVMLEMVKDIEDTVTYFKNSNNDSTTIQRIVRDNSEFDSISLLGHSTGGGAAVLYCAANFCENLILQDPFLIPFLNAGENILINSRTHFIYSEDWFNGYEDSENITEIEVFKSLIEKNNENVYGFYLRDAKHYDFVAFGAISPLTKYTFLKGKINYGDSIEVNNYFNRTVLKGESPKESFSSYLVKIK